MSIWNGIATGVGSLFGGVAGAIGTKYSADKAYQSQKETNEQNYKIWQEQQAHNIQMFNMENEANIDMWNMQNAYNDPSQQVARLRNAGLNPSLAIGNNASGVATSAPGVGSLSSAHAQAVAAPTMQQPSDVAFQSPWKAFADGALQGLVQVAQAFNLNADSALKEEQETDISETRPFRIRDLTESYGLKQAQAYAAYQQGDVYRTDAEFNRLTKNFRVEYSKELTQFLQGQKVGQQLSNRSQEILNKFLPGEKHLQMLSAIGGILQQGATYRFTEAQIRTELERALSIGIESQLKGEELKTYKTVAPYLIKDLISTHELNSIINQSGANYFNGVVPFDVPKHTYNKLYPHDNGKHYFNNRMFDYWKVRGSRPTTNNFNVGFKGFNVGYGVTE